MTSLKKAPFFAALFVAVAFIQPCRAGLKVYYMRHGETGANVQAAWAYIPKDNWPDYVGKTYKFTPLGELQVAEVPRRLSAYHFDLIAVGPLWRTRHTILPYLTQNNLKAEIWPELTEFGQKDGDMGLIGNPNLPPPAADILTAGKPIELAKEEQGFITLLPAEKLEPKLGRGGRDGAADITALIKGVISKLGSAKGTDKSILLVGHGNNGSRLLKMLTDDPAASKVSLANTGLWMAEEQPDGSFKIKMINDHPVP